MLPEAGYVTVTLPEQMPAVIFVVAALTVMVAGDVLETEFVVDVAESQLAGQFAAMAEDVDNEKLIGCPLAVSWTNCAVGCAWLVCALNTSSGGPAVKVVVLPTVKLTVMGSEYRFASPPVGLTVIVPVRVPTGCPAGFTLTLRVAGVVTVADDALSHTESEVNVKLVLPAPSVVI